MTRSYLNANLRVILKPQFFALLLLLQTGLLAFLMYRPVVSVDLSSLAIVETRGHAITVQLETILPGFAPQSDSSEDQRRSILMVFEDERIIGPAHSVHEDIAAKGGGAFSHWGDLLVFSASDNSDPRTNGRSYKFVLHLLPISPIFWSAVALLSVSTALLSVAAILWLASRPKAIIAVKVAGLVLMGILAPWLWSEQVVRTAQFLISAGQTWQAVGYSLLVSVGMIGLALVPFIFDWRFRLFVSIPVLVGFCVDRAFFGIAGSHLSIDMMEVMLREAKMAGGVIPHYFETILLAAVVPTTILALTFFMPVPSRLSLAPHWILVPSASFFAIGYVTYATNGRIDAFASPYGIPAKAAIVMLLDQDEVAAQREQVSYNRPLNSDIGTIIMILDESVRGDVLGLNSPAHDSTPFLNAQDNLFNYGVAISAANCSVATRVILRLGLRPEQLPETTGRWRSVPSIWQFAKKAGYRTVLLDGHTEPGQFHSHMTAEEAQAIDEIVNFLPAEQEYLVDLQIAQKLAELVQREERQFIYVNKLGVHADYRTRYPASINYLPKIPRVFEKTEIQKKLEEYQQALWWNVDQFFKTFLPAFPPEDALLIYTSDHGQSLYQGGYELTHCSLTEDLHLGEVMVPLFVVSTSERLADQFAVEAERAFGRASHFELFPTLLKAMGYDHDWTEERYGPSLFEVPTARVRGFILGSFDHPNALWTIADPED